MHAVRAPAALACPNQAATVANRPGPEDTKSKSPAATGGQVEPEVLVTPRAAGTSTAVPLAAWLILAALLLIALDATLRRPLRLAV